MRSSVRESSGCFSVSRLRSTLRLSGKNTLRFRGKARASRCSIQRAGSSEAPRYGKALASNTNGGFYQYLPGFPAIFAMRIFHTADRARNCRCPIADQRILRPGKPVAGSRYISREAAFGARSRKSMNVGTPVGEANRTKPPPPRLPAEGCVTASVSATVTAASIAFPPDSRTASPASVA